VAGLACPLSLGGAFLLSSGRGTPNVSQIFILAAGSVGLDPRLSVQAGSFLRRRRRRGTELRGQARLGSFAPEHLAHERKSTWAARAATSVRLYPAWPPPLKRLARLRPPYSKVSLTLVNFLVQKQRSAAPLRSLPSASTGGLVSGWTRWAVRCWPGGG
jgi:hypothetical protein